MMPKLSYPVAHVLVGMIQLRYEGGVLGKLALSNSNAVFEAHQLCLQLPNCVPFLLPRCLS